MSFNIIYLCESFNEVYKKDYSCEFVNYNNRRFEDSFVVMSKGCLNNDSEKINIFIFYFNVSI